MKQYTTPEQTAKLIELGFEKPKSIGGYEPTYVVEYEGVEVSNVIIGENKRYPIYAYSIGELIEILPKHICLDSLCLDLYIYANQHLWIVKYSGLFCKKFYRFRSRELADALYDMVIQVKKEGVI